MIYFYVFLGILIPFFATGAGSAAVFFLRKSRFLAWQNIFCGFAGGVMTAASVWSLLLPAIEKSNSAFPATFGLMGGVFLFAFLEKGLEQYQKAQQKKGKSGTGLLTAAVTLHNIPEGMAVGVIFSEVLSQSGVGMGAAMVFAIGIAIQNLPEGAILSLPAAACGISKKKAFFTGALSGVVEPLGAIAALILTGTVRGILPYTLAFAAGAMLYVVVEELVPTFSGKGNRGVFFFAIGFSLMMFLDVTLG